MEVMHMTINDAVEITLNGINPEWSDLEKIRYAYVTIGGLIQKHTDFFFSVDNKLGDANLSLEKIKEIYKDKKDTGDLKVICRSAAYILERIYTELGIESKLVKTNSIISAVQDEEEYLIHHWILVVKDGDNNYFLTLSADLAYIQIGMETRHFASNIPYKRQIGDKEVQVYQGDEIKPTVLDKKTLRDIDIKIGYLKNKYNYDEKYRSTRESHYNYSDASLYMLSSDLVSNRLYNEMEEQNTYFYNRLIEFDTEDRHISLTETSIEEITQEEWNIWLKKLCKLVHRRIEKIIKYRIMIDTFYDEEEWNYEDWLRDVCVQIQRYLHQYLNETHEELWVHGEFNFSKWSRQYKKTMGPMYDVLEVNNILMMLDKTNALATGVLSGDIPKGFMTLFNSLSYHFVKRDYLLEGATHNGIVSSKYIAHKFKRLFTSIFECNNVITDLNRMEYSEQIVIIKMIIDRMFPELNSQNGIIDEFYNENYSIVQNRIQIYSVKHKNTGEYNLVFHIVGDDTFSDTYYFYETKTNKFGIANILRINRDYIIVSDRLRTRIEEMEDIEEKKNKR
jgi:hypothetical protein